MESFGLLKTKVSFEVAEEKNLLFNSINHSLENDFGSRSKMFKTLKEKGNNIPKTCRGRVSACSFVLLPIVTEKGCMLFFKITFAWKILC